MFTFYLNSNVQNYSRSRSRKLFGFYQFQSSVFLFIVAIVISILIKSAFSQTSINSQSQVKVL